MLLNLYFLETPCTRRLKLVLCGEGKILVRFTESPSVEEAAQMLSLIHISLPLWGTPFLLRRRCDIILLKRAAYLGERCPRNLPFAPLPFSLGGKASAEAFPAKSRGRTQTRAGAWRGSRRRRMRGLSAGTARTGGDSFDLFG